MPAPGACPICDGDLSLRYRGGTGALAADSLSPTNHRTGEGGYAAIVMADVLEHLDDPVGAIRRCRELLRPGGVLCLVTPDPSSLTARIAGSRWWGFLPAHTFLVPRLTLRELVLGEGLFVSDDVSFVRTFSARYWLGVLSQRGGAVARAIRPLRRGPPPRG